MIQTPGYYGAKKASEPLHIQWNAATDAIEVVNYSAGEQAGLTAHAEILNLDGSVKWEKSANARQSRGQHGLTPIQLQYPGELSRTHFIRLTLSRGGQVLSSNFYLRGVAEGDYEGIRNMPQAKVEAKTRITHHGSRWAIIAQLHNVSTSPALMVRVKAVRAKTGDPILPALYNDNYIALMPGERKSISVELEDADTRGEKPRITVDGYNLTNAKLP